MGYRLKCTAGGADTYLTADNGITIYPILEMAEREGLKFIESGVDPKTLIIEEVDDGTDTVIREIPFER